MPGYMRTLALDRVEDLMVQAMPWRTIVAMVIIEGYTDSSDTVRNWRREVEKRWAEDDAASRPARKDLWRARLEHLYGDLLLRAQKSAGHPQVMLFAESIKVAKLLVDLDGVTAPIMARADGIPIEAMTPLEREIEIKRLLAAKDAAIAARARRGAQGGN